MQKRSYPARRINVTAKPGRFSGFSSIMPCGSQPEQNETDEPPSLFKPLKAGIRLYGLSRINTHPFCLADSRPFLFLSKTHIPKEEEDFFAGLVGGFIVRDDRGRIKTIIFGKKRST